MTNPARQLHTLLSEWAVVPKAATISASRGGRHDTLEYAKRQILACRLLGEVGQMIDRLTTAGEDMSSFETFLPQWWRAVVLPNEDWRGRAGTSERQVINVETLASLASFAAYLDKSDIRIFDTTLATIDSTRQVRDALDDLVGLLNSDELGLSTQGRIYVFTLIDELRTVFDAAEARIDLDVVQRIHQLKGYLSVLADDFEARGGRSPLVTRLRDFMRRVTPVGMPVAGVVGYLTGLAADAATITNAITGG